MTLFALIGISETLWIAVLAAIRSISWILGISYIGAKVIDLTSGSTTGQEQASQDATIEAILARTDLTPAQKSQLIQEYLDSLAAKAKTPDYATYALYAVAILAAAYVVGQFIGKGGKK